MWQDFICCVHVFINLHVRTKNRKMLTVMKEISENRWDRGCDTTMMIQSVRYEWIAKFSCFNQQWFEYYVDRLLHAKTFKHSFGNHLAYTICSLTNGICLSGRRLCNQDDFRRTVRRKNRSVSCLRRDSNVSMLAKSATMYSLFWKDYVHRPLL